MQNRLRHILLIVFFFQSFNCIAEKYWISFTDKGNVIFDPLDYFSQRTIDQRQVLRLSLYDTLDFPVNENYCKTISIYCDSLSYASRWLNGIAVYTSEDNIFKIQQLQFVASIEKMNNETVLAFEENGSYDLNKFDLSLLHYQTDRLGGKDFASDGITGKGIRIAVFDAGFKGADENYAFKKLRNEKRIIATYDFTKKNENVFVGHWHGTATLSCIVGELDSVKIGLAVGAEILLARTERVSRETYSEEEYWLAAAEWADRNGANIISSSLGYTNQRYFNSEMNGHRSLVARAATIAAAKGILVINAAGNEARNNWHFIDTPGDADSVLTVGGTDPETDFHIQFSSFGPTSDGRLKPNVTAPGHVTCAAVNGLANAYGTSFSTPLVAGFAACAWQKRRELTNMQLFREIEKSGHLYPYFDYAHGYGIPQAKYFINPTYNVEPTFDFVIVNDQIKVVLREKYSYFSEEIAMGYESRRNLYYKIESKEGLIKSYTVYLADKKEMLNLQAEDFTAGDQITIHFEGYTGTLDFPEVQSEEKK